MSDDTDGPHVHTLTILLFFDDLWGHVQGRAENLAETLMWFVIASESKVSQLNIELSYFSRFFRCEENILRLNITMHYVLLMHVIDGK